MTDKTECMFFLAINDSGDFEVDLDEGDASTRLTENSGGSSVRIIKLTAWVKAPEFEEVEIDVPDTAGTTDSVHVQAAE